MAQRSISLSHSQRQQRNRRNTLWRCSMDKEVEIVLVDDDPADVELAIHALRENQLANHIEVLRDGEEALAFLLGDGPGSMRFREKRPRLILLDLKLPKTDG